MPRAIPKEGVADDSEEAERAEAPFPLPPVAEAPRDRPRAAVFFVDAEELVTAFTSTVALAAAVVCATVFPAGAAAVESELERRRGVGVAMGLIEGKEMMLRLS